MKAQLETNQTSEQKPPWYTVAYNCLMPASIFSRVADPAGPSDFRRTVRIMAEGQGASEGSSTQGHAVCVSSVGQRQ